LKKNRKKYERGKVKEPRMVSLAKLFSKRSGYNRVGERQRKETTDGFLAKLYSQRKADIIE